MDIFCPFFSYVFLGDISLKKVFLFIILFIPFRVLGYNTSAKSSILMDMDSHRVIYGKDINYVQSVASISKVMTAICVIENTDIDKEIVVSDEILKAYGSGIYVQIGEKIKIIDLLYGLMMRSGNDAAIILAKNTSGDVDKFVSLMNETGRKIGMKNSVFKNPSGLDEEDGGNLSSAYDMALLMSYAMKNKKFRKVVSTKEYVLKTNKNVYKWKNKNKLLYFYKYTTGGKTGFTRKAKRTLVSSASKDNLNLVVVTINDGNDFKDHVSLFEEAFSNFNNYVFFKKGNLNIPYEDYYRKGLYVKRNISYPLTLDEENIFRIKYELSKKRKYKSGDSVGNIKFYLGDEEVLKEKIYVRVYDK